VFDQRLIGTVAQIDTARYFAAGQVAILRLAQHALTSLFAGKTLRELQGDADLGIPSADRVNITLRHAGRIRGSMSAPGSDLGKQIVEAVYRAAMDRRFGGPLTKSELPRTSLEVWIQTGVSELNVDAGFEIDALLGIDGFEIEGDGKSAYYKPSVPVTSKNKSAVSLFEALCRKAGLEKDAWRRSDVCVRKTQWVCVSSISNANSSGQEFDSLAKTPIQLDVWVAESASYLVRNQQVDGLTAYLYDPIADQFKNRKRTNLVRAAGCLFALSQVLQSHHVIGLDATVRTATLRMARGLLRRTLLTTDGTRVVSEEKAGEMPKLGATALLAAALSGGILREEFAQEYQQIYRSVVLAQKTDGRFITRFGLIEEGERESNFYSGQALLVLALEAERGNNEALEMCRRAFQPYVVHFRKAPTSAFVGWHVDVWSRLALLTGDQEYADFAFEQTDWLLQMQVERHRDLRWVGGFSQSGAAPKFSSIVFLEATVRALTLAIKTGHSKTARKYADCVRSGLQFCRLLRVEETPPTLLGNPTHCKGGVTLGLIDRRVRCDVVQHFITLCLVLDQIKDHVETYQEGEGIS
jgi:AMMECR1 domain-containing protein